MLSAVLIIAKRRGGFAMDTSLSQQHDDEDERLAGGFLVGRAPIHAYLVTLGLPEKTDPYYLKKTGWPIGNTGGNGGGLLIASKRKLARHCQKLATPA
jgi:hypothetical protein